MVKKKIKKKSIKKTSKKNLKTRLLYLQIIVTLLIAVYLIVSSATSEKTLTGNVIMQNNQAGNSSMNIFFMLGIAMGVFTFIEILIMLVISYL
jgi:hypothetical protein